MRGPTVSVLVPVFNGAPFLAECLDSILAQDLSDFELLLSDDGSTDGSLDVARRYARQDGRIRVWQNPRTLGIGANFNACLRAGRAEFAKFVLQDDKLLDVSALRRMVEPLEADSSVSLVASASRVIDARSRVVEARNRLGPSAVSDGKAVIVRCLEENANLIGEPSLVLFRKSQAARGFDEGMKQLLDVEMWFHLLEQGQLAFIAEPLCAFRQHPAQQTEANQRSGAAAREGLALAERYYARPWMSRAATPRMVFAQMYYLRKQCGDAAGPLLEQMAKSLSGRQYAACWLRHRLTRPIRNFRRWCGRRGIRA